MTDTEAEFNFCKMEVGAKEAWLTALRSGDYKQGYGHLRQCNGQDVYCCLGVLQDIIQPEDWIEPGTYGVGGDESEKLWSVPETANSGFRGDPSLNDGEIQERLMDETDFDSEAMSHLITMNDGELSSDPNESERQNKKSFGEIADWIEENL